MTTTTATITPQQQFERDGFYIHREPILAPDRLARAAQGLIDVRNGTYETGVPPMARNWHPGDAPDTLAKLDGAHWSSNALYEALIESRLGELAGAITGADRVQVWALQGLYKPPVPGTTTNAGNVGWHQDQTYWTDIFEDGSEIFTAWLALSDVTPDSGPMQFVAGSHTWGTLDAASFFEQDQDRNRANVRIPEGASWMETTDTLPAGGVSFHHRNLLHGSHQNVSPNPRISMAIHLRTDKSKPRSRTHTLTKDLDNPRLCPVIYRH